MKFAICNETYQNWTFEDTCDHIAQTGYTGVEVAPFTINDDPLLITDSQANSCRSIAENAGLEIIGLHWLLVRPSGDPLHLTSPDDTLRKRATEYAIHLAHLCAAMGGYVMVWGSPKQRDIEPSDSYEEGFKRATEVLQKICSSIESLGVTIAMEPLAPSETNFLQTAEETIKLIHAVDHPACRLHLDVKAMSSEPSDIPYIIKSSASYIEHFHANDPNLRGPGFGDVDFTPIAAALKDIDYRKYISVEVFDYSPDPQTIATQSLDYLHQKFG